MKQKLLLISLFLLSRCIVHLLGVTADMTALADYWQYPDLETMRHNLMPGVFYQAAQPPLFSIILGLLLKGGDLTVILFFKLISLVNTLLILSLVVKATGNRKLAFIIAAIYLLSPSTILLENELFYTGFISMLLLAAASAFQHIQSKFSFTKALLAFSVVAAICLTRSFYHLGWMCLLIMIIAIHWWPRKKTSMIILAGAIPFVIVSAWYLKNQILFNQFGTTSWTGMNLARITFHNHKPKDSSNIATYDPFLPVSYYGKFLSVQDSIMIPGGNYRVLTSEYKNGAHINLYHARYQEISMQYRRAALQQIKGNPLGYLKNVAQAIIIFFTPASSYFKLDANEERIRYYDAPLTLNFAAFFDSESKQKKALALAAVIIAGTYLLVGNYFWKLATRRSGFSLMTVFSIVTMLYVFLVGNFMEYGENMRFRYEIQPLFLILMAMYLEAVRRRRTIPSSHT